MEKLLKRLGSAPLRVVRRALAGRTARRLATHTDSRLRAVGAAVRSSLAEPANADDRRVFATIEARREALLASTDTIEVIDFGAGSATDNRTREQQDAGVLKAARVADVCNVSKSPFWAGFLFHLVDGLEPRSAVELGTCVGISASYQGSAMRKNGGGHLVSLEGAPTIAELARGTLDTVGVENVEIVVGPFHETLDEVMRKAAPIDYFFNDGHHDHDAVIRYFDAALPYLSPTAVVVFDDIAWSPGMRQAWDEIKQHPKVAATVDLGAIGVATLGSGPKEHFTARM